MVFEAENQHFFTLLYDFKKPLELIKIEKDKNFLFL